MPTRRHLFALAAAAAALSLVAPVFALGGLVEVSLVDRDRSAALPNFLHQGASWVAGRPGSRYAVRLVNRTGGRVLVVLSIDGVNAVSGETAATAQTGYVLAPWQSTEITGWRKSLTEAAAFYFSALPDSYAARTDRPDNVGVIGAAVFVERAREPVSGGWPHESNLAENDAGAARRAAPSGAASPAAPAMKSAEAARDEQRLGTGHGEREYMPTTQTRFDRASERPNEVLRLRYDSEERLVALGVIKPPRRGPRAPDPFPQFVPDPRG
jgi:hypothetical protein